MFYYSDKVRGFMLFLLFSYVITFVSMPEYSKKIYYIFTLLSLPVFFVDFRLFRKDPFFILLFLSIIVQFLSWFNSGFYFDFVNDSPKLDRLAKLFSFLFIAYWLRGSKKLSILVLLTFVLGFILSIVFSPDFSQHIDKVLLGKRVDFNIKNAQYTSMFSGISIIILIGSFTLDFKKKFNVKSAAFILAISVCFILLFVSQSRQVWFAIFGVFLISPIIIFIFFATISIRNLIVSYLCLFTFSILIINVDFVKNRIENTIEGEIAFLQNVLEGKDDINVINSNSVRIVSWMESIKWIKDHPISGSSPNAISEVIRSSDKFTEKQKSKYKHLHSFHIELLVAYGILGALVIYGMYYWLIRSLVLAHRENPELKMFTVLGICFLIFWIIINFFESFSSRSYGVYVHNIMFGCLYTFYFTQQRKKIEEAEACT